MATPVAILLNLLGYVTGAALYAMLLAMLLWQARPLSSRGSNHSDEQPDHLPLLTATLGLTWNVGALALFVSHQLHLHSAYPLSIALLAAVTFSGLGFLPAVVVHSVLRGQAAWHRRTTLALCSAAYLLSAAASLWHVAEAWTYHIAPAQRALQVLTLGYVVLTVALLWVTRAQASLRRSGWVLALAVFAVSALHLSQHESRDYSWWVELIGHQASLPLAVAILYQDYRFALADWFLKRALALIFLVGLVLGLYLGIAAPLLQRAVRDGGLTPLVISVVLGLWVAVALCAPWLWWAANWFVNVVVLRRTDYDVFRAKAAQRLAVCETPEEVLREVCAQLATALTARDVRWDKHVEEHQTAETPSGPLLPLVSQPRKRLTKPFPRAVALHDAGAHNPAAGTASVIVPVSETPAFRLLIGELAGGRRLLSDDLALLEALALLAARRIDHVRVAHERCVRDLQEEEIRKLATEAELRALRAQINPHFLFNALTTIGYLIQTSPERALQTLMKLTTLLRGVLRSGTGEFCALGAELDLIEAYLEIERARFEERLRVLIDVPYELRDVRIPALLLQPLVENAIKHGITPSRQGGEVVILARTGTQPDTGEKVLQLWVRDTGVGADEAALAQGRAQGVGLLNVVQRIERHYAARGTFALRSAQGIGTTAEITLPLASETKTHSEHLPQFAAPPARAVRTDFATLAARQRNSL